MKGNYFLSELSFTSFDLNAVILTSGFCSLCETSTVMRILFVAKQQAFLGGGCCIWERLALLPNVSCPAQTLVVWLTIYKFLLQILSQT